MHNAFHPKVIFKSLGSKKNANTPNKPHKKEIMFTMFILDLLFVTVDSNRNSAFKTENQIDELTPTRSEQQP